MNDEDFQDLLASIREAGRIHRGELAPSRVFELKPPDARAIRKKLGKTQEQFAAMIGVSVGTLRNWEQGRRRPEGPAQALLRVAEEEPELVAQALSRW